MGVNLEATLPGLLKKKGMTQEELGRRARITRNDVNAMAKGRLEVGRARLTRIAEALEVSALELGAPLTEADEVGETLLDRLAAAEAAVERERKRFDRFVRATSARLAALEAAQEPQARRSGRRPREAAR